MTTIYRVEDVNGYGMYYGAPSEASFVMCEARHPVPENDALLGSIWKQIDDCEKHRFNFGFASLEQLKFWIYQEDWRKELNRIGYKIFVYECDGALIGDTQAVFLKEKAKLSKIISLMDI